MHQAPQVALSRKPSTQLQNIVGGLSGGVLPPYGIRISSLLQLPSTLGVASKKQHKRGFGLGQLPCRLIKVRVGGSTGHSLVACFIHQSPTPGKVRATHHYQSIRNSSAERATVVLGADASPLVWIWALSRFSKAHPRYVAKNKSLRTSSLRNSSSSTAWRKSHHLIGTANAAEGGCGSYSSRSCLEHGIASRTRSLTSISVPARHLK